MSTQTFGLLFDMDGTIFAVPPHFFSTLDTILQEVVKKLSSCKKNLSQKEIRAFWHSGRNFEKILIEWGIDNTDLFWYEFDEQDYLERKKMIHEQTVYLFPDAREVLNKLRQYPNIKKGILSNTPPKIAIMQFSVFNLDMGIFDQTYFLGSVEQIHAKPSPVKIQEFMKIHGLHPENTFIIGDTSLDIKAGKNAGIKSILIKRHHNQDMIPLVSPDYEIKNLNEIFSILSIQ
ncbi:MAG: HAD family hydrolase [Candidatus Helarchaeota archaeon]